MMYRVVKKDSGRLRISRNLKDLPLHKLDEWELTTDKGEIS